MGIIVGLIFEVLVRTLCKIELSAVDLNWEVEIIVKVKFGTLSFVYNCVMPRMDGIVYFVCAYLTNKCLQSLNIGFELM